MVTLLVVDDEPSILHAFRRVFEKGGVTVLTAKDAGEALRLLGRHQPDTAVLDVVLPDQTGLELFQRIQQLDPKLPVIFITSTGDSETAIEATKLGALDYLVKPLDFVQMRRLVRQALDIRRLMREPVAVSQTVGAHPPTGDVLVGRCAEMQLVYKAVGRVAPQNITVLIRGESGTGKELVARALYHHSKRSQQPFMEVNCAAIPEGLLESELFGHEKGAFTGADRKRIGKFEQCQGGTLFLDEIGDMTTALQSKILRALQEQRFERVGGNETIQTDVRVIAATNRDLERMVSANQFRSDLYYRLNGYTIKLPPLRERADDLLLLVDHFLMRSNRDLNKEVRGVSPEALDTLRRYPWPGNVRELQSVLRQSVLQTAGPVLLADFLPDVVRAHPGTVRLPDSSGEGQANFWGQFVSELLERRDGKIYDRALSKMEVELLTRVLRHTDGNQVEAAKLLGLSRTTLRAKIRQAGIAIDRSVHLPDVQQDDEPPEET